MYQDMNNNRRTVKELEKEHTPEQTRALSKLMDGTMTETKAMDIINAIWPGAPEIEKKKAAMLCATEGWNPLKKHVFLIPHKNGNRAKVAKCECYSYPCPHPEVYDWVCIVGIGAKRLSAQQKGDFSYVEDTPRVMSPDEQKRIYGEVATDRIIAIVKLKNMVTGAVAVGYGNYLNDEKLQGAAKGNTRANMAFTRAESQALDRLGQGKAAGAGVEVVDERFLDLPDTVRQVDTATGEIIDGTVKTLPDAAGPAAAAPPASSGALSDNLGTCPKHHVPWKQFTKRGTAIKFLAHPTEERDDKKKIIWCGKEKVEREMAADAAAQPADGEFTEQNGPEPGTEPPEETGATDNSGGQEKAAAGASTQEKDGATGGALDEDLNFESKVRELAEAIWGTNYRTGLNKFLSDNFSFKDLRSVKVEKRAAIVEKLTGMVNKLK
jgi:hypothetical protein